jgi:hypothetical protein
MLIPVPKAIRMNRDVKSADASLSQACGQKSRSLAGSEEKLAAMAGRLKRRGTKKTPEHNRICTRETEERLPRLPTDGCGKPGRTLRNYLRAAQAYMLISMPTGTSTIFGVFQIMRVS